MILTFAGSGASIVVDDNGRAVTESLRYVIGAVINVSEKTWTPTNRNNRDFVRNTRELQAVQLGL